MYIWMEYNIIHTYTYYVFNKISIIQKSKYSIIRTLPYLHYLYSRKYKNFHFMKLRYGIEYQNIESAKVVSIQIKIIMKRILLIIFKSLK